MRQLDDGLWRWTARHPEWHPRGDFGAEVASFLVQEDDATVLVDPLLPDEALAARLDALAGARVTILVTIPYHVRSAGELAARWAGERQVEILGHAAAGRRLGPGAPFRAVSPGDSLPHGITAHAIGNPRRQEQPFHLPTRRALAFGDAIVGVEDGLRVWLMRSPEPRVLAWHRDRFVPSLAPLLDLDVDVVLPTHGEPVLRDGARALREALETAPFVHRG